MPCWQTYLEVARAGIETEVALASRVLPNPQQQVRRNGSLMVCTADKLGELKKEFDTLVRLGSPCEFWGYDRVVEVRLSP